jgi:hypothetical protein
MKKKENLFPYLKTPFLFIICILLILTNNNDLQAQSPPPCSLTVDIFTNSWVPQPSRNVNSGEVLCIVGNGTYNGVIHVHNGGHVVVCGSTTIFGSVAIDAGASYWHSSSTGFTGSLAMNGTEYGAYNCNSGGTSTRTTIADGNFNDMNTWSCACIPASSDNVVIDRNIVMDIDFSQDAGLSFTVNSGKTLDISAGYELALAGDLSNSGTINGDLKFNGTSSQIPVLGDIESLELDNAAGMSLSADLDISGALTLTNGLLSLNGYTLTLKANSSSTAIIVDGSGSISGDITIEQYVPVVMTGHHFLSNPTTNASLSELNDDYTLDLTGTVPNIYYYDEPSASWQVPASAGSSMVSGRGYTGYFSGNIVVDISGTPNSGTTTVSLTNDGNGWNLIGNPYPSAINWDLVTIPAGVSDAVYIWDHDPATWGSYSTYIDNVGANGGTSIIPMMQSFFVGSTVNTNFSFEDNYRITDPGNSGSFLKKAGNTHPLIRLQLSTQGFNTEAVIRYKNGASLSYDLKMDALHLASGEASGVEFATVSEDNKNLIINTLPDSSLNNITELYLTTGTSGNYSIEMTEFDNFPSAQEIILYDRKLSVAHDLKSGAYNFISDSSDSADRFYINTQLSVGTELIETKDQIKVYLSGKELNILLNKNLSINSLLTIYDILGKTVFSKELTYGSDHYTIPLNFMNAEQIYFVRIEGYEKTHKILSKP